MNDFSTAGKHRRKKRWHRSVISFLINITFPAVETGVKDRVYTQGYSTSGVKDRVYTQG